MATNLSHEQFRQGGMLSIFLGRFDSEAELDQYLSATFPIDFGFAIDPADGPEYHIDADRHCPVGKLLNGFSRSKEFSEVVAKGLVKRGWHRSRAAIVFNNFSYDPKVYPLYNHWGRMKFMGTFDLKTKTWTSF